MAFQFFHTNKPSKKRVHQTILESMEGLSSGPESLPLRVNCSYPINGAITFKSHFKVHAQMAAKLNLKKMNWTPAVQKHVQYSLGFFNYNAESIKNFKIYPTATPELSDIQVKPAVYGRDLIIDKVSYEDLPIESVKANDQAYEVSYSATLPIIGCGPSATAPSEIRLVLPLDPYLAYWFVPPTQRMDLGYSMANAVTNPCADTEMAELKAPSQYWYVWNPEANGYSRDAKKFDCKEILKQDFDYSVVMTKFNEIKVPSKALDFSEILKKEKLDIKMILGFLDGGRLDKTDDIEKILTSDKDLVKIANTYLNPKMINLHPQMETTLWSLLQNVQTLSTFAELKNQKVEMKKGYFLVHLEGSFKKSGWPFNMEIFLGPTDQMQKKALHWDFLKNALATSDMLFYLGHAGMGANVKLQTMKNELKLSDEEYANIFKEKSYQLFSITSCFSTNYYSTEYVNLRKNAGKTSDLILTGSRNYLFNTPLQTMAYFELIKSGKKTSLSKALGFTLNRNEIITVERTN